MSHSRARQVTPCVQKTLSDSSGLPSPLQALVSLYDHAVLWNSRWQERQHLRELDEHILKDIGLTPDDVRQEVRKPFWRP